MNENNEKTELRDLYTAMAVGFQFIGYIIAGLAIGYGIDKGISAVAPWGTVVFSMLGLVLGIYKLYVFFRNKL